MSGEGEEEEEEEENGSDVDGKGGGWEERDTLVERASQQRRARGSDCWRSIATPAVDDDDEEESNSDV